MTAPAESLAQVIATAVEVQCGCHSVGLAEVRPLDRHIAEAVIRDGYVKPRVITTVAELTACNLDAVVVDFGGCPRTKRAGNSHMGGGWTHAGNSPLSSAELADGHPMTVIFEGRPFSPRATRG